MALNIKDPEVDALVRALARETGESITTAVERATRERLERLRAASPRDRRQAAIRRIVERASARPVLDARPIEDIIPYDENGLPI